MSVDNTRPDTRDPALRWRSRRGLLELELLLLPFVRKRLASLSAADKALYARLLEHDDCDIFDWIQARAAPDDPELVDLVAAIRAANGP